MGGFGQVNFNPNILALMGLLGGISGGIPTPSSMSGSGTSATQGTSSSGGTSAFSQTGTSENQNLLNYLNNLLSTTQGVTTTTPTMSPEATSFLQQLTKRYSSLAAPSLTGYQAQQTAAINANADAQRQAVSNIMATRGLGTSPIAATSLANIESGRLGQITNLNQQIPLLMNQQNLQNLAGAASFFSAIPKGATTGTTQTQTQAGSGQQTGLQTGQTTNTGFGSTTQNTQSTQNTQQNQIQQGQQGGGVGGALSGAASLLLPLLLFSDKRIKKNIDEIRDGLDVIRRVTPREWKWKDTDGSDGGVIAQELEAVLPDLVHETPNGLKAVNYAGLIPYLVSAVKHLDQKVNYGTS